MAVASPHPTEDTKVEGVPYIQGPQLQALGLWICLLVSASVIVVTSIPLSLGLASSRAPWLQGEPCMDPGRLPPSLPPITFSLPLLLSPSLTENCFPGQGGPPATFFSPCSLSPQKSWLESWGSSKKAQLLVPAQTLSDMSPWLCPVHCTAAPSQHFE